MISAITVILTAVATLAADGHRPALVRRGGDPARGLMANYSAGSRPFDAPDPTRVTVVFVHGFNPLPRLVHFGMAEEFADSLSRRGGASINLLAWQWNAATCESLRPSVNLQAAVRQGHSLAQHLMAAGVDPARTHLIGQSVGGIVVTTAARDLAIGLRRPVAQITLLDPATYYHSLIFKELEVGSLAPIVENYWSPGPSAFGNEVAVPGVLNYRVDSSTHFVGLFCPLRSDHLLLVRWYLKTVEDPRWPGGFNSSPFTNGPVL
ncbi:hypothetical protein P12x_003793 [Tundrisphaera lichenicola]|uniref:hypothetical protein n=1 Tax=Tundrisphaera lichenicola TaxID=2029860 RepID=UPI003EC0C8F1